MRNKSADQDDDDDDVDDTMTMDTTPIAVAIPVVSNNNSNDNSTTPLATSLVSDEEARAAAAAAREEGIADIRNHCEQHLSQNPQSSYVTWVATLHPENAQVTIDPRFLIPGNPWLAVYEEAKEDLQKGRGRAAVSPSAPDFDHDEQQDKEGEDASKATFSGCLDLVVGVSLVFTGVTSSFAIEICAAYAYLSYWLCCKIVDKCSPPGLISWLPFFIAGVIGQAFRLIDIILLFVSIVVAESFAAANYLVCTMLACSHEVGKKAHQTTRKLSHLVRWAFRKNFEEWEPPRAHYKRSTNVSEDSESTYL